MATSDRYGISRYAHKPGGCGPGGAGGWEVLPTARLRPYEERHVQLADVITSFRRHWRAAVAAVLLVSVGLGLFLFLRDQTRPPDQWEASIELLVPVRDEEGNLPDGVPPMLLQGQSAVALSARVTDDALSRAGIDPETDGVTFEFDNSERGDIIRLTVTAPTEKEAQDLAGGFTAAYTAAPPDGRRGIPGREPGGPGEPHHAPGTPRGGRGRARADRPRAARQPARHRR